MILLIPGVLVLQLVFWIIYLVAGWAAMLVGLAGNLILLPIAALVAVACLLCALAAFKTIIGK
jgi:hypothetical protein